MIDSRQALKTRNGLPWRWWLAALLVEMGLFLLAGPRTASLLANTAWLILGTLAISLPLGTWLAILIAKTDVVGRKWLERLLLSLLLVPLYVQAAAWQAALGWGGWLSAMVPTNPGQLVLLDGWRGAIWVHAMAATPWVALFVATATGGIARELEEDALLSGSPGQVIWRVTLRHALVGVTIASLWVASVCASEITVTDLFQIRSIAEEVYTAASLGELTLLGEGGQPDGYSNAAAGLSMWPGMAMLGVLLVTATATMGYWLITHESVSSPWRWQITGGRWLATGTGWLLAILLAGIPLASMAWKAGTCVNFEGNRYVRSWAITKLAHELAVSPLKHRREWGWSFVLGAGAAMTATTSGVLLAWGLRKRWLPVVPVALLLALGFSLPGPVLGVWLIRWLNWPADSALYFLTWCYDQTLLAPLLAQTIRALPLVTIILWMQMESVPQDLLDNATSEGAGGWSQLVRVVLPLRWPGVLAAMCVAFILAIGELAATLLVVPPGVSTLSIRIFGLLYYGAEDQVAALCLDLWLLTSLLTYGAVVLIGSGKRQTSIGS